MVNSLYIKQLPDLNPKNTRPIPITGLSSMNMPAYHPSLFRTSHLPRKETAIYWVNREQQIRTVMPISQQRLYLGIQRVRQVGASHICCYGVDGRCIGETRMAVVCTTYNFEEIILEIEDTKN